jgi:hypothetical protein
MQQALQQWEKPKRELKTIRHRLDVPLEPEQRQALHAALVQQLQVSDSVADIAVKAVESGIVFIPRSYHSGRTTEEGAPAAELAVLTGRLRTLFEAQARLPGFNVEKVLRRDPLVLRMRPAQLRRTVRVLTEQAPDVDPGGCLPAWPGGSGTACCPAVALPCRSQQCPDACATLFLGLVGLHSSKHPAR